MIGMDAIITEFLGKNWMTVMGILYLLQIVAKETPWACDDKIIQILMGWMKKK